MQDCKSVGSATQFMKSLRPIIVAVIALALLVFAWGMNKPSVQAPPNATGTNGIDGISLGQPCDASEIAWANNNYNAPITESHGLQCEVYNQTASTSNSTSGVWGYPDAMRIPELFSFAADLGLVTQTWNTYRSPGDSFSFRYPPGWRILNSSSSVMVLEGPYSDVGFQISYYPRSFEDTNIYRAINSIPDNTMSYKASIPANLAPYDEIWPQNPSVGSFYLVNHFMSDGNIVLTAESMDMVSRGGDIYSVNAYTIGRHGYLTASYEVGLGSDENVITGLSIESARLEK